MKNLLIILVADNEKMIEILKNAFAEAEQENNQGLMNFWLIEWTNILNSDGCCETTTR